MSRASTFISWLIKAIFLLSINAHSAVSDGNVIGYVDVKVSEFAKIGNQLGSTFFAGHTLKISLSEVIDVNPTARWEEDCFLGICGNRRNWIEHHWKTPLEWGSMFRVVDETGTAIPGAVEIFTNSGQLIYNIPVDSSSGFNRKLRLEAKVVEGNPPINRSTSQGRFKVTVTVDTARRVNALFQYLNSVKPTARELKEAWTYDPFFLEQNRTLISRALVNHAKTSFPPASEFTATQHREILEYASEIDPQGTQPMIAVAEMFLAQGKSAEAERELIKLIKTLQALPNSTSNPDTQISLARSFVQLASTIEKARGYLEDKDLSAIVAHYGTASEIAIRFRAPVLAAEALRGRAMAMASRNTISALRAAAVDFKRARELLPKTFRGIPLGVAPGGKELIAIDGDARVAMSWRPLDGNAKNEISVEVENESLLPLAVDMRGRVLATSRDAIGWINLSDQKPKFIAETIFKQQPIQAWTNGRISVLRVYDEKIGSSIMLLNEALEARPMYLDSQYPHVIHVAAKANRYVAISNSPSGIVAELREVSVSSEALVRRITVPNKILISARITPDGKRFGMLTTNPTHPSQQLDVWDESGAQVEVSNYVWAVTAPPPEQFIHAFDFSPEGSKIFVVRLDGSFGLLDVTLNSPTRIIDPENRRRVLREPVLLWADENTLIIDMEGQNQLQSINWPQLNVRNVGKSDKSSPISGFWKPPAGTIGTVLRRAKPVSLVSMRTSDGAEIGRTVVERTVIPLILNGGRFACLVDFQSDDLFIRDLLSGEEKLVAQPKKIDPNGNHQPLCIRAFRDDEWLLVIHQNGKLNSVQKFKGLQPAVLQDMLPPLPPDLVFDASKQLKVEPGAANIVQNGFRLPGMLEDDPHQFAWTVPPIPVAPSPFATPAPWISYAYVLLHDDPIVVKRMRLQFGSVPLKVLGPPMNKVIYERAGKVSIKDLMTNAEGTFLFNVPIGVPPQAGQPGVPPPLPSIRLAPDGTTLIFGELIPSPGLPLGVQQRVFELQAGNFSAKACKVCEKKSLLPGKFLAPGNVFPLPLSIIQSDTSLRLLAGYSETGVTIHDVKTNSTIAGLPPAQLIWLGPDRAFFISGKNEFSFIRF